MSDYHEPTEEITARDRNFVRALASLKEEIDAINWYHQRIAASDDDELKAILAHNRDEEMEHACMALEWLRRNMEGWDDALKTYLFTEADITTLEKKETGGGDDEGGSADTGLGIGSLKEE